MKKILLALATLAFVATSCIKTVHDPEEIDETPAQLVSFKLLAADNEGLDADYEPEAIAASMVIRIPGGGQGKTLKATLTAGENDEIKVNDAAVADGKASFDASFPVDIVVTNTKSKKSAQYEVKIGKILQNVITQVGTYSEPDAAMNSDIRMAVKPADNTPYILYSRKKTVDGTAESNNRLACVSWKGGAFSEVGTLGFTDVTRQAVMCDLAFNGETLYALSYGETAASICGLRKFDGTEWVPVGEKGFSGKVTATYGKPQLYFIDGNPGFVTTGNIGKSDPGYRNATRYNFDGTAWVKADLIPGLPTYGEKGGSDGMFYAAVVATDSKGNVYVVTSCNQYGYYMFNAKNGWEKLVDNYLEEGEPYGVPSSLSVMVGPGDVVYVLAAVSKKAQYQLYRYNKDAEKKLEAVAAPIQLTAGSNDTVAEPMRIAVNPVSGEIVGVYGQEKKLYFSTINENGLWNEFTAIAGTKDLAANDSFALAFDANGNCFISFVAKVEDATSVELYKYGQEDDILPE